MRSLKFICLLAMAVCSVSSQAAASESRSENPDLRISVEVDKECFVGEALAYRLVLTSSSPNIADVKTISSPKVFPTTEVKKGVVGNQRPEEKIVKGRKVYSWTLFRYFVFPTSSGKYEISEGEFIVFVPYERIVDDFFWGRTRVTDYEEFKIKSEKASFKVVDLPSKGRPDDFSGAVGDFSIEGWFPPGQIREGQEAIAVFKISGYGSLENLKLPNMTRFFNNGCSLLSIEQNENLSQKNGNLFSEIILTCSFIPHTSDGEISPVEIMVFNPDQKKYETISSSPLKWNSTKKPRGSSPQYDIIEI